MKDVRGTANSIWGPILNMVNNWLPRGGRILLNYWGFFGGCRDSRMQYLYERKGSVSYSLPRKNIV